MKRIRRNCVKDFRRNCVKDLQREREPFSEQYKGYKAEDKFVTDSDGEVIREEKKII